MRAAATLNKRARDQHGYMAGRACAGKPPVAAEPIDIVPRRRRISRAREGPRAARINGALAGEERYRPMGADELGDSCARRGRAMRCIAVAPSRGPWEGC